MIWKVKEMAIIRHPDCILRINLSLTSDKATLVKVDGFTSRPYSSTKGQALES